MKTTMGISMLLACAACGSPSPSAKPSGPAASDGDGGSAAAADAGSSPGNPESLADCQTACSVAEEKCLAALKCVPNPSGAGTVCPANNCDYDDAVCVAGCPGAYVQPPPVTSPTDCTCVPTFIACISAATGVPASEFSYSCDSSTEKITCAGADCEAQITGSADTPAYVACFTGGGACTQRAGSVLVITQ